MKLYVLISFILVPSVICFCEEGESFLENPQIRQVALDQVRVNWNIITSKKPCFNNFIIKYWPKKTPSKYQLSGVLSSDLDFYDLIVVPQLTYAFQVIARIEEEDTKRVKWFKARLVEFTTSHAKSVIQYFITLN